MRNVASLIGCLFFTISCFAQTRDTIFLDSDWKICTKEHAAYYRFATIQKGDTSVFYRGSINDFYKNHTLQMEGNYSDVGKRDGVFTFYYPDGKVEARGRFNKGKMHGNWEFYYPDEKIKAKLYYAGNDESFIILNYFDEKGNNIVKEGTGKFSIPAMKFLTSSKYIITGEFLKGDRIGTWKFEGVPIENKPRLIYTEVYDNGVFKRGIIENSFGGLLDEYDEPSFPATLINTSKFINSEKLFTRESSVVAAKIDSTGQIQIYDPAYGNTRDTIGALKFVEIEAAFPGGTGAWRKFLEQNLKAEILVNSMPASIKNYKQTVWLRYIVCEDGTVCNVEVTNKEEGFKAVQEEAKRVIEKSGKWMPAVHLGKNVKSFHIQPITFIATSE